MIERLVGKLLRKGQLTLVTPDGKRTTYGPGGGASLTVRLADRKTMFADRPQSPARPGRSLYGRAAGDRGRDDPRPDAAGGRRQTAGRTRGPHGGELNKGKKKWKALFRRNPAKASRRNVAHHYDIGNDLYRLFLDKDLQYSCAYLRTPRTSLDQAQSDKKAHIAAKLYLKPGQRVLDIGSGWGGTALYLQSVAGRRRARRHPVGRAIEGRPAAGRGSGRVRPGQVRADRLSLRSTAGSTGSCRSACSSMLERRIMTNSSPSAASLLTDDGVMLLHTIGKYRQGEHARPIHRQIYLPRLSFAVVVARCAPQSRRARLIASDVETLRLHYAYTLRHWLERTQAREGQDRRHV